MVHLALSDSWRGSEVSPNPVDLTVHIVFTTGPGSASYSVAMPILSKVGHEFLEPKSQTTADNFDLPSPFHPVS